MTIIPPPSAEFHDRLDRLRNRLNDRCPDWEAAVVTRKMSIYYLTGTMVVGAFWIPREGDAVLFVRNGYGQAQCNATCAVQPMRSYRDMVEAIGPTPERLWLEKDGMTLSHFEFFNKYFNVETIEPLDNHLMALRAVKSKYEIDCLTRAGVIHAEVLEEVVPRLMTEGMSEAQLAVQIFNEKIKRGAQGLVRLNMFETQVILGYVCFGLSSLLSNDFVGPGGVCGLGTTVRCMGSRNRKLVKGDLVYIDSVCTYEGYHTDKTAVYLFGTPTDPKQEQQIHEYHKKCVSIQVELACNLKPGVQPSELYASTMEKLDDKFRQNFMGYADQQVRFLGHGVGLTFDELPAIAKGFDEPLVENMVFAVEPKYAIENVGMVGTENTYLVTPDGGHRLTGRRLEVIEV
ncbi:MAG: Xaa-Pro peptidase family protein [Planctomycetia bacterium]|jgi:Xaa-Pro aminopeptidase